MRHSCRFGVAAGGGGLQVQAKFVFVGAGGWALLMLQKAGIPEVPQQARFQVLQVPWINRHRSGSEDAVISLCRHSPSGISTAESSTRSDQLMLRSLLPAGEWLHGPAGDR